MRLAISLRATCVQGIGEGFATVEHNVDHSQVEEIGGAIRFLRFSSANEKWKISAKSDSSRIITFTLDGSEMRSDRRRDNKKSATRNYKLVLQRFPLNG